MRDAFSLSEEHMKKIIYADNAATTKLHPAVLEAMLPWLTDEYANASQPYAFSRKPKKALAEARRIIAECINAQPEEIYFTSGGTESDNWVIKGSAFSDTNKKETITSAIEHHAILHACSSIEHLGYPVKYLSPDNEGIISPETLEMSISKNTRLVSIMFSNNEIGTIEPIKELAKIAHKYGALFHTDAVQALGHIKIDVKDLGVDLLSASAHKFNGPKGIGFLYIKKGTIINVFNDGGSQERGMRAGTENIAAIVGMAKALKINCDKISQNTAHLKMLEEHFLENLNSYNIDYVRNGAENHIYGNISLSFKGFEGEAVLHRLDLAGVCVSTGSACNSESTQISHVLQAINLDDKYAKGTIRISLGEDNTLEDVEYISRALKKILL